MQQLEDDRLSSEPDFASESKKIIDDDSDHFDFDEFHDHREN